MSGFSLLPISWDTPFAESSDVSVDAASTVRICTFPRSALEETVRQSPGLEHRLHEQALCELDDVREWMTTLGQMSAAEKIATFLLLLSHQVDPMVEGYSDHLGIPLKRSDIADFLGLTIETSSRQ